MKSPMCCFSSYERISSELFHQTTVPMCSSLTRTIDPVDGSIQSPSLIASYNLSYSLLVEIDRTYALYVYLFQWEMLCSSTPFPSHRTPIMVTVGHCRYRILPSDGCISHINLLGTIEKYVSAWLTRGRLDRRPDQLANLPVSSLEQTERIHVFSSRIIYHFV